MSGPDQSFQYVAGVTPCPNGWLVLPARLATITLIAEDAFVEKKLADVLDRRPAYDAGVVNTPIGFREEPGGPYRACEVEARQLVGWPRRVAISGVPSRRALNAQSEREVQELEPWMTRHDVRRLRWLRESANTIEPFHSRRWFSGHPDVSFTAMNGGAPLRTSPYQTDGQVERLGLIEKHLPGAVDVVTRTPPAGARTFHVQQAAALLWTARRAASRAIRRIPQDPPWDDAGMRMEIIC